MRSLKNTYFDTSLRKILILIITVSFGLTASDCEEVL